MTSGGPLASTYRSLIEKGDVVIAIEYDRKRTVVDALHIPLATGSSLIEIPTTRIDGRVFHGWAGRVNLQEVDSRTSVRPGLRLVQRGRLIRDNEWFGYNYQGKGALNALVGELHLSRFTPVPNKTDFVERGDDVWDRLGEAVLAHLQPLIAELRAGVPEAKVTKREKELAREVREELGRVLSALSEGGQAGSDTSAPQPSGMIEPGGRARPTRRHRERPQIIEPRRPIETKTPRSVAPDDAVGNMARLVAKITGGTTEPPIRIGAWDSSERSAWVDGKWLDINKNYALYREFDGAKAYLAETAILELSRPQAEEAMTATQYIDRMNLLMSRWMAEVARSEDGEAHQAS